MSIGDGYAAHRKLAEEAAVELALKARALREDRFKAIQFLTNDSPPHPQDISITDGKECGP